MVRGSNPLSSTRKTLDDRGFFSFRLDRRRIGVHYLFTIDSSFPSAASSRNKDEITALQMFYYIPFREKPTFEEIRGGSAAIGRLPRSWTPEKLWAAYQLLEKDRVHGAGGRVVTDLVSLVRFARR